MSTLRQVLRVGCRSAFWLVTAIAASSGTESGAQPSSPCPCPTPSPSQPPAFANVVGEPATYEVVPQARPTGSIEFKAVWDLKQEPAPFEPRLRGAEVAASKDWPASLYVTFDVAGQPFACTAALVGPTALLTAAHCVPTAGSISFSLEGKSYETSQCDIPARYSGGTDPSADFALCRLKKKFSEPAGFRYETVETLGMTQLVGTKVILGGYGCTSDKVDEGRADGRYRIGYADVDETSKSASRRRGADLYSGRQENNLFTADDAAYANLCPGDSGGPAFRGTPQQRLVVGVNSRVFYKDRSKTTYGGSIVSATGGPDFRSWAKAWAEAAPGTPVCGVFGTTPNCRH